MNTFFSFWGDHIINVLIFGIFATPIFVYFESKKNKLTKKESLMAVLIVWAIIALILFIIKIL